MTNRSMSLSGPIVPRAAEPKSTIFSGLAALTTCRTTSAKMAGSGFPRRVCRFFPIPGISFLRYHTTASLNWNRHRTTFIVSPPGRFFNGTID
jgi:hypothetical protein